MARVRPAALAPNAAAPTAEDTPSFRVTIVNSTLLSDRAHKKPVQSRYRYISKLQVNTITYT